jgi:tetratricopeptide (TPR) repeat protein
MIWSLDAGQRPRPLAGHKQPVTAVAFSPDGRWVATVSSDGTPLLWDAGSGGEAFPLSAEGVAPPADPGADATEATPRCAVAFSPDGALLAVALADGRTRVWDIHAMVPKLRELAPTVASEPPGDGPNGVPAVAFNPSATELVVQNGKGHVTVWDLSRGTPVNDYPIGRPQECSGQLAFDGPEGSLTALAFDGSLKVKQLRQGQGPTTVIALPRASFPAAEPLAGSELPTAVAFGRGARRVGVVYAKRPSTGARSEFRVRVEVFDVRPVEDDPVAEVERRPEPEPARLTLELYRTLLGGFDPANREHLREVEDLIHRGSVEEAARRIERTLSLPGLQNEAAREGARLAASLRAKKLWADGNDLARNGKPDEAADLLGQAKRSDPGVNPATDVLGVARQVASRSYTLMAKQMLAQAAAYDPRVAVDEGKYAAAVEKLRRAAAWDPKAMAQNPEEEARTTVCRKLIENGLFLVRTGRVVAAMESYKLAGQYDDPDESNFSARDWNELAWWGSLWGEPAKVAFAADKAMELAPRDIGFQDTRGLVRVLTGDLEGARKDFDAFAAWEDAPKYLRDKRRQWADRLRKNDNPFADGKLLVELREEGEPVPTPP